MSRFSHHQLSNAVLCIWYATPEFVSDKDIKAVCSDLRKIYSSADRQQAEVALEAFGQRWDIKYKEIKPKWEANWEELMAFMDYGANIRRMIYTTNPVEALHRVMRKVTKTKGAWVNDKGLLKQLYLALKYNKRAGKETHSIGCRYTGSSLINLGIDMRNMLSNNDLLFFSDFPYGLRPSLKSLKKLSQTEMTHFSEHSLFLSVSYLNLPQKHTELKIFIKTQIKKPSQLSYETPSYFFLNSSAAIHNSL